MFISVSKKASAGWLVSQTHDDTRAHKAMCLQKAQVLWVINVFGIFSELHIKYTTFS